MPTLPISLPVIPAAGDLVVSSMDDVIAAYPPEAQGSEDEAPVLAAQREFLLEEHSQAQLAAGYAAAQSDVTRATGIYLDGLLGDDRGVRRTTDEEDEAYRDRALGIPSVVTPKAILDLVNSILAPYTDVSAQIFESIVDRWFVGAGSRPFAFLTQDACLDPEYDDRYYSDRDGFRPGGSTVFSDSVNGRLFVIRIPAIKGTDPLIVMAGSDPTGPLGNASPVGGFFLGSGTSGDSASYPGSGEAAAVAVYQAIVNAVMAVKGQGVRYRVFTDPRL